MLKVIRVIARLCDSRIRMRSRGPASAPTECATRSSMLRLAAPTAVISSRYSSAKLAAVETVPTTLLLATAALEKAGVPYAVAGDNAVAAWVARVDRAAVRTTHNVDILLRRSDFEAAKVALETVGFHHHEVLGVSCFIDGIGGSPRDAVHLLFAGEKVRAA